MRKVSSIGIESQTSPESEKISGVGAGVQKRR